MIIECIVPKYKCFTLQGILKDENILNDVKSLYIFLFIGIIKQVYSGDKVEKIQLTKKIVLFCKYIILITINLYI